VPTTPPETRKVSSGLAGIPLSSVLLFLIVVAMLTVVRTTARELEAWMYPVQIIATLAIVSLLSVFAKREDSARAAGLRMIPWLLASLLVPPAIEFFHRSFGFGEPLEFVTLIVIVNCIGCLVVLSRFPRYRDLLRILSSAFVFFAVSIANVPVIQILAVVFTLILIWSLISGYWSRLENKFADECTSHLFVRSSAFAGSMALVFLAVGGALLVASPKLLEVAGFSWFSGGEEYGDDFARDGEGNGQQIRAATEYAHSFGPVDSRIFLESRQLSLFDAASENYGPPRKADSSTAIGLDAEAMRHNHSEIARSQRGSADFSTMREPRASKRKRTAPESQLNDSLFLVMGKVPLHFSMECYDLYDNGVWRDSHSADARDSMNGQAGKATDVLSGPGGRKITVEQGGKLASRLRPVYAETGWWAGWMRAVQYPESGMFQGTEYVAVKTTNLESARIPSPPCLSRVRIDLVDRPDFFGINPDGIVQLCNNASRIPEMTVIHLASSGINLYAALSRPAELQRSLDWQKKQLVAAADSGFVTDRVASTAAEWTQNAANDWERVEAIVNRLRRGFRVDPDACLPKGETDAACYLLRNGKGTDYMFATAAVMMLRSSGIPARIVSGFYARKERYDRRSGHTLVLPEDIHTWAEITLDGHHWIPVEPTPGYESPRYHLTTWQRIAIGFMATGRWIAGHPLTSTAIGLVAILAFCVRRWIVDRLFTLHWYLTSLVSPGSLVRSTWRLLEKRSRLSGVSRPKGLAPVIWHREIARRLPLNSCSEDLLSRFGRALNAELYRPASATESARPTFEKALRHDCTALIRAFSYTRLRQCRHARPRTP
jgi:protein-glutamine gamma-glutamyltransferase